MKGSFRSYKGEKVIIGEEEEFLGIKRRKIKTKSPRELEGRYRGEYITKIVDAPVLKLLMSKIVCVYRHRSVRINSSSDLIALDCERLMNTKSQILSPPEDDPETYASKLPLREVLKSNRIYRDYSFNSKFKFGEKSCEIFSGFFEFILDDTGDIKIFEFNNEKFIIAIASEYVPKATIPPICAKVYAFCVTNKTLHEIEDLASKIERHLIWTISRKMLIPEDWKEEIYHYIPRVEKFRFYLNDPDNYDELKYPGDFGGEILIAFADESYKLPILGIEKVEKYLCKFVAESPKISQSFIKRKVHTRNEMAALCD